MAFLELLEQSTKSRSKMKSKFFLILSFFVLVSCKKKEADNPVKGEITIAVDESFRNVAEALTERYVAFYPNAKINLKFENENLALTDLLKDSVRVIIMSRSLTEKEVKLYKEKVGIPLQPARFAADGVVFIAAKNSPRNSITKEEIKNELLSNDRNIIFDGLNSSNFNFLTQKFNLKPEDVKCSVLKNNTEIINNINNFPNSVGVISYNTISSPFSKEAADLRDKIKILPIVYNGKSYEPTKETLINMTYPFTRVLYYLTNEGYFGLGNGLIRFSCTQKGQIVVSKEGLQPYYIFKREVIMR